MVVAFLSWLLKHVFYYYVFKAVFARLQPAYVLNDSSPPAKHRRFQEVPGRVVAFLHALYTVMYGYGYLLGLCDVEQLMDCRAVSTSYLFFDMLQSFRLWRRKSSSSTSAAADAAAHPYGVAFHHITTLLFIHGWLCGSSTEVSAMLLYFRSELPVIFLNATWLFIYVRRSNTRACAICSNLTVVTYCLCRMVLFPLVFVFKLSAGIAWLNPLSLVVILLLALVYLLNVLWFAKLVRKNVPYLPRYVGGIPTQTLLPQYTCGDIYNSRPPREHVGSRLPTAEDLV